MSTFVSSRTFLTRTCLSLRRRMRESVLGRVNTNIDICIITHVFDSYLSLLKETHVRVSFRSCEYKYRYLYHHAYFWLWNHVSVAARMVESNQYRGFRSEQLTVSSRGDKIGIHTRGVTHKNRWTGSLTLENIWDRAPVGVESPPTPFLSWVGVPDRNTLSGRKVSPCRLSTL